MTSDYKGYNSENSQMEEKYKTKYGDRAWKFHPFSGYTTLSKLPCVH